MERRVALKCPVCCVEVDFRIIPEAEPDSPNRMNYRVKTLCPSCQRDLGTALYARFLGEEKEEQ